MPTGIYLHIPFCRIKCPYCDFNTYAGIDDQRPRYVAALKEELRHRLGTFQPGEFAAGSLYFGGGTPSLLDPEDVAELGEIAGSPAEVTLEANPGTVDLPKLQALRAAGVNRLTLGCQTFHPELLAGLRRLHDVKQTHEAIEAAHAAGFTELNIDLMYGLSGQTLAHWDADLDQAAAARPTHLSLYNLTIEEGTPFARWRAAGELPLPGEELQGAMYERAVERAETGGWGRYEVSNFALPGSECRHNQVYWSGEAYLGCGAGAHGFAPADGSPSHGRRWWNHRVPRRYCQEVEAGRLPEDGHEELGRTQAMTEALLLGLRTREGLDLARFQRRFGASPIELLGAPLKDFRARELIRVRGTHLIVAEHAVILLDSLLARLAPQVDRVDRSDSLNSPSQAPYGTPTGQSR
ncbi:MAG: radical SAM family heme chaperone HemW [Proteobacteria bacterium]|nr:radical SAM family heme chaperone HemW [Pseudomonadota bacterium]